MTTVLIALLFLTHAPEASAKQKPKVHPPAEVYTATVVSEDTVREKSPKAPSSNYDAVPADQVQPLLKRLRLVEELITRHHRAYDYRTLTTKELEAILAELPAPVPAPLNED